MPEKVNPIREGCPSVTPCLIIKGAAKAMEFYKEVFDAQEVMRLPGPDGSVGHAEIGIEGSPMMLADEFAPMGLFSPVALKGTPVHMYLYVVDSDAVFDRAVKASAKVLTAIADQFYCDRTGTVEDPFGHMWHISSHVKDVSSEEMQKQAEALSNS